MQCIFGILIFRTRHVNVRHHLELYSIQAALHVISIWLTKVTCSWEKEKDGGNKWRYLKTFVCYALYQAAIPNPYCHARLQGGIATKTN